MPRPRKYRGEPARRVGLLAAEDTLSLIEERGEKSATVAAELLRIYNYIDPKVLNRLREIARERGVETGELIAKAARLALSVQF